MAKDDRRFVIVPREVLSDERYAGLREDRAVLGAWLLLYFAADAFWPAAAPLPRWVTDEQLELMNGLVDVADDHYRMAIVDDRRTTAAAGKAKRSAHASVAARARWNAPSIAQGNAASNAPGSAPSNATGIGRASIEHMPEHRTKSKTQTERISTSVGRPGDIARDPGTKRTGLTRIGETT